MFVLTLHNDLEAQTPADARSLTNGHLRVGRAPDCDWIIDDPNRLVSRHHFRLGAQNGRLTVTALGTNGVSLGNRSNKLPIGLEVCLEDGDWLGFGTYRLLVAFVPEEQAEAGREMTLAQRDAPAYSYSLLNAFCDGAQIDPSSLIAFDSEEVMKRAGQIYRAMIEGLDQLMNERKVARRDLGTERTAISTEGNNLLKWAPAQRQAIDLLIVNDDTFVGGKEAVEASFLDLKKHLVSLTEGYRSGMLALLDFLRPELLAAKAPHNLLRDRGSEAWGNFVRAHRALEEELSTNEDGVIRNAFSDAYDRSMRKSA